MSPFLEETTGTRERRGLNLVSLAKPYFGLIVLTTALLSMYGVYSMFRMPSGIYPEVNFPRIVVIAQTPGLAVNDVEVAVTRPIEVEPQALVAGGLSISDVADRLGKEHRLKAVGRLDRGTLQYQVLIDTQVKDPLDLEKVEIAEKNGQPIRLRDLGRVTITHEDRLVATRSNGQDAVVLTVFRRLGGNTLTVSHELDKALADAAKNAQPGVKIIPVYDEALLVRTAIDNVRDAIVIGGTLSVIILLMFLKSVRATLIAALSIPLSLMISFVFLYLTGDTLNLMSLGGLAVAIGLIIDDTVVVIENIARHIAEGDSGDKAVDRASKEISGAVVGSAVTTILVFLPLAFIQGMVGQFFQSLSIALTVSLLVSMVVSLTIVSVLAARFLGVAIESLREDLKREVPELPTEFTPTIQNQINNLTGAESPIEVKVFGSDQATLRGLATEVGNVIEKIAGVVDVNTNVLMGNPDIIFRPDSVATGRVGLTVMDVESQLSAALYGQVATTLPEQDRMTNIRVRYPDRVRFDRDRLGLLPVSLASATPALAVPAGKAAVGVGFVPLGQLASIRQVRSPNELNREIEYIDQLRAEGMRLHDALLKAGRVRFRPILMALPF